MIRLKEVKRHTKTNSVEATWVNEADEQVKCHSYADVQMDMLRADLGADAPGYEQLMAAVEAAHVPPPPPTAAELAAIAQQIADAEAKAAAKADATVKYLVTHTPAEVFAKVSTDITDLASARQMIARLAVAIGAGLRNDLR